MIGLIIIAALVAEIVLIIFLPALGWSILALLALLLLILLFVPVGVHVKYAEAGFCLSAKISRFEFKLLPRENKEKPDTLKPTEKKEAKPEKEKPVKEKKSFPFNFEELLALAKKAIRSLGKFGKLTVHKFMLHYIAAGDDPYKTAVSYNYVNAALSSLAPVCVQCFRVKDDVDVWTNVDFTREKMLIEAEASVTLRLIQLLHVALVFAFSALGIFIKNRLRLRREKRDKIKANKSLTAANNTEEKTNINTEERMDSNG